MEKELNVKSLDWPLIVEYFTKRGKPLTQKETELLLEEDQMIEDTYQQDQELIRKQEEDFLREQAERPQGDSDSDDGGIGADIEDMEHAQVDDAKSPYRKQHYREKEREYERPSRSRSRARRGYDSMNDRGEDDYLDDLNQQHLTAKDYTRHKQPTQSKSVQKKKRVTVPKPFAFDTRENTKPKGIRERKLEQMIAEKELKEKRILKHQFRAKDPPPEVTAPRYNSIVEKNEQRRLKVLATSKEVTKKNERPFKFYERDL